MRSKEVSNIISVVMPEEKKANKNHSLDNLRYIADMALEQIKRLDAASDSVDSKAGILLGFTAILVTITLGSSTPNLNSPLQLLLSYTGTAAFFASIILNILAIHPRVMRFDPKLKTLVEKYISEPPRDTLASVSANLADAWEHNHLVLESKVKRLNWALWLVVVGIFLLIVDVLVVAPMS